MKDFMNDSILSVHLVSLLYWLFDSGHTASSTLNFRGRKTLSLIVTLKINKSENEFK